MKNKKGKKLVVLGAMAALLTLIGVSGSQTYAKYVEATKVTTEQATVAKWNYTVSLNAENLFHNEHQKDKDATTLSTKKTGTNTTIVLTTDTDDKVVAPGVAGSMTFGIEGNSEVAAKFIIDMNVEKQVILDYTVGGAAKKYMPLKWTLEKHNGTDYVAENLTAAHNMDGDAIATPANITYDLADIVSYLDRTVTVGPNADSGVADVDLRFRLSYEWAFSTSTSYDDLDTLLGENAQAGTGNTTVKFALSLGIEQTQVANQHLA